MGRDKSARRAAAIKRDKRKKLITISICATVVITITALFIYNFIVQYNMESRVFANGALSATLLENGSFSFVDCQLVRSGKYTETTNDGVTTVEFTYRNQTVYGNITDDVLTIPGEWDSGKGHNPQLIRTE